MDINNLHCFLVVAELGNVSRAAAKLHMTQPALSKMIKRLEEELGVAVFNRLGNRIELNECGVALRSYAEKAIMEAELLHHKVSDLRARRRDTIFVGYAFPTSEPIWLFEGIRHFAFENPDVDIRVTQLDNAMVGEYLRSGRINIAVSMEPFPSADLIWREVLSDPMGILVASDHPLAHKEKVWLSDLQGERIYCPDPNSEMGTLLRQFCNRCGFSPDIVFEGAHGNFISECVWNRLGVSFVSGPFYTVERANFLHTYVNPQIIYRKLWDEFCIRTAGVTVLRNVPLSSSTQAFYDILLEHAADHSQYTSFEEDGAI